jgi:hypothetical protein
VCNDRSVMGEKNACTSCGVHQSEISDEPAQARPHQASIDFSISTCKWVMRSTLTITCCVSGRDCGNGASCVEWLLMKSECKLCCECANAHLLHEPTDSPWKISLPSNCRRAVIASPTREYSTSAYGTKVHSIECMIEPHGRKRSEHNQ